MREDFEEKVVEEKFLDKEVSGDHTLRHRGSAGLRFHHAAARGPGQILAMQDKFRLWESRDQDKDFALEPSRPSRPMQWQTLHNPNDQAGFEPDGDHPRAHNARDVGRDSCTVAVAGAVQGLADGGPSFEVLRRQVGQLEKAVRATAGLSHAQRRFSPSLVW